MRVVYLGRGGRRLTPTPAIEGDVIELMHNSWDDFGRRTLFNTACRINGEDVELGSLKLLIAGSTNTAARFGELLQSGWDGSFPIPNVNYISVPSEIEFYAQLMSLLGDEAATNVARNLRDASLLTRIEKEDLALAMVETDDFRTSLLRERGAIKAFADGWQVFESRQVSVESARFHFRNVAGGHSILPLNMASDSPLPHDINVLIGPNGVGKSRVLHGIVRAWLRPDEVEEGFGFERPPNVSQLVVLSYSPLEAFPVDTVGTPLSDREIYRYFGFRGRPPTPTPDNDEELDVFAPPPPPDPVFDTTFPRVNAAHSLIDALGDDQRYGTISDWPGKLKTMYSALMTATAFDYLAVTIDPGQIDIASGFSITAAAVRIEGKLYLPIRTDDIHAYDADAIRSCLIPDEGVTFVSNGERRRLSSGQRLFSYVVINILGAIRRNSLILVDEPELFLHPTLEIQFIEMLKGILASLSSKALLATHSEVTVRETPSDCVHVFQRTDDGIALHSPPFQTFAGDIQRISSYVFGDRTAVKPYEAWIHQQLSQYGSANALIAALGHDVNEELLIQIRATEAGRA